MIALIAFLFVIGILVFIHEMGHFLVAKWRGVRVERFSLGFGKKTYRIYQGRDRIYHMPSSTRWICEDVRRRFGRKCNCR